MTAPMHANLPTIADDLANNVDFRHDWQAFAHAMAANSAQDDSLPLDGMVQHYINGKGMACPLPLLKLKIALKTTACGNQVYLTATDPNSEHDIGAFCRMIGHDLSVAHLSESAAASISNEQTATIIHLLITKNC